MVKGMLIKNRKLIFLKGWIMIFSSLLKMVYLFSHINLMVLWKENLKTYEPKMIKKMQYIFKAKIISIDAIHIDEFFFHISHCKFVKEMCDILQVTHEGKTDVEGL